MEETDERPEDGGDDASQAPPKDDALLPVKLGEAIQQIGVNPETGLVIPRSMQDQLAFASYAVRSGLLPPAINSTAKAWMVMQRGQELGFPGLGAFEFLYVVGGQVRLKPDGAKAKALGSGLLIDAKEETFGEGDSMVARVTLRRKGIPTPFVGEFSVQDAKTAKLWGKVGRNGPSGWVTYPKRMLLARARGFAYGDAFRDIIGGLPVREVYDVDPEIEDASETAVAGEGRRAAQPPPATPDPFLDELAGQQAAAPAPAPAAAPGPAPKPPEPPVEATTPARDTAAGSCSHSAFPRPVPAGKVWVCPTCSANVRGPWPKEDA